VHFRQVYPVLLKNQENFNSIKKYFVFFASQLKQVTVESSNYFIKRGKTEKPDE
jgi:hypothetical protein